MTTAQQNTSTLSLHDALPIYRVRRDASFLALARPAHHVDGHFAIRYAYVYVQSKNEVRASQQLHVLDRKSTRLNSSHRCISYAVFCLKKKKKRYVAIPGRPHP